MPRTRLSRGLPLQMRCTGSPAFSAAIPAAPTTSERPAKTRAARTQPSRHGIVAVLPIAEKTEGSVTGNTDPPALHMARPERFDLECARTCLEVDAIETGGIDVHQQFASTWRRPRQVDQCRVLGSATAKQDQARMSGQQVDYARSAQTGQAHCTHHSSRASIRSFAVPNATKEAWYLAERDDPARTAPRAHSHRGSR